MCQSMVNIQSPTAEIRRGKKRKIERNYRMKIYMVSLLHRATINNCQISYTPALYTEKLLRTEIRQGGHHGTTVLSCHIFLVFSVVPKVNLRGKWLRFIYRPYTILLRNQVTDENLMEGKYKLECGPMPNVMAAMPNIGGALCSTPQSLDDAHY